MGVRRKSSQRSHAVKLLRLVAAGYRNLTVLTLVCMTKKIVWDANSKVAVWR